MFSNVHTTIWNLLSHKVAHLSLRQETLGGRIFAETRYLATKKVSSIFNLNASVVSGNVSGKKKRMEYGSSKIFAEEYQAFVLSSYR